MRFLKILTDLNEFNFENGTLEFDDINYWSFIIIIAGIFLALLVANVLIKSIKPLRKLLIPAPVLGGFLLLAVLMIYKAITGKALFNTFLLEMITYHCLGLGFVATSLKKKKQSEDKKKSRKGIFNSSLITVSSYLIQGIVGIIISLSLYFIIKSWPGSGILLPMGFGQGPGQAYNWGRNYQNLTNEVSAFGSFENGVSFGLTIAAMGYVAASIGGIVFLNSQRRKGNIKFVGKDEIDRDIDHLTLEDVASPNDIPSSGTVDKLSIQLALIFIGYAISFGIIFAISKACDASGVNFLINTIKPLFWGFNFIIGTGVAVLIKVIINKLQDKKVVKKEYINNYLMNRVAGFFFDVMVVAAIGSIDLTAFANPSFILPLALICALGGIVTYIYVRHVCKHLFSNEGYYEESFLCMYGMLTGTASTGVILLREIDPDLQTPASPNMVYQTLYSVLIGAPVLLLMSFVVKNMTHLLIGLGIYIAYFVILLILIKRDKLFKKKDKKLEE